MATARANRIRASAGSFRATKNTRSRVAVYGGSGDTHADQRTRQELRDLSQDLERNAEPYTILTHGISRLIGAPDPRPTTPDQEWNRLVSAAWTRKAEALRGGFDDRHYRNWPKLCEDTWRSAVRDGDLLSIPTEDMTIQSVEADQIVGGPGHGNQHRRTFGGVTTNSAGRDLTYWVAPRGRGGHPIPSQAEPIDAQSAYLLRNLIRMSQTRGLPAFFAGLDNQERVDALLESEVITAEQASNIYGAFRRPLPAGYEPPAAIPLTDDESPVDGASQPGKDREIGEPVQWDAGSFFDLPAGVEWQTISPQRPNLNVVELARHCQSISSALFGIPYAVLYCDFKGVNWSGNRGLVSLTRDALHRLRKVWAQPHIDWVYGWWLEAELTAGRIPLPDGVDPRDPTQIYAHAWDWPQRPEWPDPMKEESRHEKALAIGTDSLHRIVGPDWDQVMRERQAERILSDQLFIERVIAMEDYLDELTIRRGRPVSVTVDQILARSESAPATGSTPVDLDSPTAAGAGAGTDEGVTT